MKKLVFLMIFALALGSCSVGDDTNSEFVVLPAEGAVMPNKFKVDSVSVITVKYRRPTNCHIFNGFYYDVNGTTRTVAINAVKLHQNNCQDDSETLFEVPLNFRPTTDGSYVFKFWIGDDANGMEQYLSYDVEVNP
ncbi:hypothetical protein [Flavobacterium sp. GT3R68]|uniref:hypothetical protein n=1 Tax=Flavobacterium sp. GT3R68 TaxID=2594437 RepID=UPI000F87B13B|nr:hypothetical protein [Flavobacterium sp. GT3R68]RTY95960.1 hypothetical protein EKL32_04760 [Flavobacterium sp. GSN2]TRW93732.1 hypothetical protein FNW07_02150 [Flavobacterium sp. GT3R68]